MTSFGILGGQGAVATMQLHKLIIQKAINSGSKQDIDFPSLLISNIPSTTLSEHGVDTDSTESAREFILKHVPIFKGNVDKVVAACNTLHVEENFLNEAFGKNVFVSLVTLVTNELPSNSRILTLCSETTQNYTLFEMKNYKDNMFIYAEAEHSLNLINNGMVNCSNNSDLEKTFSEIILTFRQEKCDAILLACTEMSIFSQMFRDNGIVVYDSLEILANHIIDETKEEA